MFGINFDSILNDVGMVMASGMLKDVTGKMISSAPLAFSSKKLSVQPQPSGGYAEPSVVFASQA